MNLDQIRERLSDGFKPFLMQLSNGRKFAVPHPEFLILGEDSVGILSKRGTVTTVDPLHIATIEDMPPSQKK